MTKGTEYRKTVTYGAPPPSAVDPEPGESDEDRETEWAEETLISPLPIKYASVPITDLFIKSVFGCVNLNFTRLRSNIAHVLKVPYSTAYDETSVKGIFAVLLPLSKGHVGN